MTVRTVGFVGWRGMVGSVLMQRMLAEDDFDQIRESHFFTTSQAGQKGPDINGQTSTLINATEINELADMDAIVILDPVNRNVIDAALEKGINNLVDGNCTVSLMLMGLGGLFNHDLAETKVSR